nr:MAG: DNA polymerase [White spot syndrome virus]
MTSPAPSPSSTPKSSCTTIVNRCGFLLDNNKEVVIYDTNSKFKCEPKNLELIGVLSGVSDNVVTQISPDQIFVGTYMVKYNWSKSGHERFSDMSNNCLDNITRPSEVIESVIKKTSSDFKMKYTRSLMDHTEKYYFSGDQKLSKISSWCTTPITTVGMQLRLENFVKEEHETVVVHNPSGMTGFNIFNSSPVYFEVHNEMDALIFMAAFLKHNSLWGEINANMDLYTFDYAGAFLDERWCHHEKSFSVVRAQLINSYYKCRRKIMQALDNNYNNKNKKRKNVGGAPAFTFMSGDGEGGKEALEASFDVIGGTRGGRFGVDSTPCPHSSAMQLKLDNEGNYGCIACFASMFFVLENPGDESSFISTDASKIGQAQAWIDERLRNNENGGEENNVFKKTFHMLADITQKAHETAYSNTIPLGPNGRQWNWPTHTVEPIAHEFVTHSLVNTLKNLGDRKLPRFNFDILYNLLNPFGKMLLVFIQNCHILTGHKNNENVVPRGSASGKWWTINFVGVNMWTFQVTKCKVEKDRKISDLACMETLPRLPNPGSTTVDDRIVFKGFCRGENLGSVGEVVSDITQSVKNFCLMVENRKFSVDKETGFISSESIVSDPFFSLEVTGCRSNRAQDTINNGRVSARVMRILKSREGARVWLAKDENAIIFENVNHDTAISTDAMERAIGQHKILYYDIETTDKDFTDKKSVITSIGFCLCTGGDMTHGGERGVFGLVAPGSDVEKVKETIINSYDPEEKEDIMKQCPQVIEIFTNEFEMLLGFGKYIDKVKPHVISGWNNVAFDDPFVFTRIVKHLSDHTKDMSYCVADASTAESVLPRATEGGGGETPYRLSTPQERIQLASTGIFNKLGKFVDKKTGMLKPEMTADLLAGAESQANTKFKERNKLSSSNKGSAGWFQKIIGGMCSAIRLDLMKVCEKAYKESLSEFNLNAVLAKVSSVGDKVKNVKDEVDLHFHLLGFLKLKKAQDQAKVHVYCCKDAYLTGIVSTSINKEGEIFRLCMDSALTEAVVTANLATPLCIGEGAICRNMGEERADRRGVGVRRHSIATDTKGGMVSQPIVNHVPYQTIDMTSLYPMTMCQNNLCTTTFVTHRQIMQLRDRLVLEKMKNKTTDSLLLLDVIDECNQIVLSEYRPIDIAVASWKNSNSNRQTPITRIEESLGLRFIENLDAEKTNNKTWCTNTSPNMNVTAAGMDYFPEIVCDINMQFAAKVNDDMHIAPASLEYMLQVLPIMLIDRPYIGAHITAGKCRTLEDILSELEKDFSVEKDEEIIRTHWTFKGQKQYDFCHSPVTQMARHIIESTGRNIRDYEGNEKFERLVSLSDRIYRRVGAFDSANDPAVRLWSSRLINVGMLVRTWNVKTDILKGIIPQMQATYRADRVVMQNKAKEFAKMGDMKRAGLNKVGQNIMKLGMNSMYGHLALRARSSRKEFASGSANTASSISNMSATGGIGGGTRHSVTANQITENARCVFGNIGCGLQMALPGTKQTYGDTDSVFCVHNIVGDGGMIPEYDEQTGKYYYVMDIALKNKMAAIIPILVNSLTKGIQFVERRDAGVGMMNIAHERLAVAGLLFAKKTYHMLHFNENSAAFNDMIKLKSTDNNNKFASFIKRPSHADGYVVPHNPSLILRAAEGPAGKKLKSFLEEEGIHDEKSMEEWFTSSPTWMAMDASVINNLYASQIVGVEKGNWIDAMTSRPIEAGTEMMEAVTQANAAFTPYKKGAFVKKGITPTTKLKGLQSLIARFLPKIEEKKSCYLDVMKNHVENFASHITNPAMMITSSRVNKFDTSKEQSRPNPLALAINNHLNPSSEISLGQKFKTVTSVSSWSLSAEEGEVPAGYFNAGSVRWDATNMKGSVPAFSVKNLSVVPNAITSVYKMVESDKTAIKSMIAKNVEVLCSTSANTGFSLRRGALSFNTGVIVTKDVAMACIRSLNNKQMLLFVGGGKDYGEDDDDDDEEAEEEDEENGENEENKGDCVTEKKIPGRSTNKDVGEETKTSEKTEGERKGSKTAKGKTEEIASSLSKCGKKDARDVILDRLLKATHSSCTNNEERTRVLQQYSNCTLSSYTTSVMKLDQRVADQMENLISQLDQIRNLSNKKRQEKGGPFKSELDAMVAAVKVKFFPVLDASRKLTQDHWKKCPVSIPETREEKPLMGVPFEVALNSLIGKHKCTDTCDMACCQSLYFVLLYTLALKFENERLARQIGLDDSVDLMAEMLFGGDKLLAQEVLKRVKDAQDRKLVKSLLPLNYNHDTNTIIFLFESLRFAQKPVAGMSVSEIKDAVRGLAFSTTTGTVWNYTDERFFGPLYNMDELCNERVNGNCKLSFITGIYHTAAVELAAACLSCVL